jgi:hypothetical protein
LQQRSTPTGRDLALAFNHFHPQPALTFAQTGLLGHDLFMKTLTLGLLLLGFATSTFALDKAELDHRIHKLTAKFESLQSNPGKRVPADMLR